MSGINWLKLAIAAALSLGILLAAAFLYQRFQVKEPLKDKIMAVPGVEAVQVSGRRPTVLTIRLGPVDNLASTYHRILDAVDKLGGDYEVVVSGTYSEEADRLFYDLSTIIYEGLRTGELTVMDQRLKAAGASSGWDIRTQLDSDRMFVSMYRNGVSWYRVVPLQPVEEEAR